jgi:hypothetical protein
MRIVIDSNVAVSAMLWGGKPLAIFRLAERQKIVIHTSERLIEEFADVLNRPKFASRLELIGRAAPDLAARLRAICAIVVPAAVPQTARDPDDDQVLAAALTARAEAIVSGDKDLLTLGEFQGIPILPPADFLQRFFPDIDPV